MASSPKQLSSKQLFLLTLLPHFSENCFDGVFYRTFLNLEVILSILKASSWRLAAWGACIALAVIASCSLSLALGGVSTSPLLLLSVRLSGLSPIHTLNGSCHARNHLLFWSHTGNLGLSIDRCLLLLLLHLLHRQELLESRGHVWLTHHLIHHQLVEELLLLLIWSSSHLVCIPWETWFEAKPGLKLS